MNFINLDTTPCRGEFWVFDLYGVVSKIYKIQINYKIPTPLTKTLKERKSILEVVLIHSY